MEIQNVKFVKSSQFNHEMPKPDRPEYGFVGRSNVGKSSLINALCNHSGLAKTSAKPGKTQVINHFIVDDEWYLVDLPGYGYAKVSKSARQKFERMIRDYCTLRPNLVSLFVLVDSRHSPQLNDLEFMSFLGVSQIPFGIVFTKADKLKPQELEKNLKVYQEEMLKTWEELPPIFLTSSEKKTGLEDLRFYIEDNMKYFYGEGYDEMEYP